MTLFLLKSDSLAIRSHPLDVREWWLPLLVRSHWNSDFPIYLSSDSIPPASCELNFWGRRPAKKTSFLSQSFPKVRSGPALPSALCFFVNYYPWDVIDEESYGEEPVFWTSLIVPKLAFTSAISICNMSLSLERRNSQRLWDLPSDLTVLLGTECTIHYHRFPYLFAKHSFPIGQHKVELTSQYFLQDRFLVSSYLILWIIQIRNPSKITCIHCDTLKNPDHRLWQQIYERRGQERKCLRFPCILNSRNFRWVEMLSFLLQQIGYFLWNLTVVVIDQVDFSYGNFQTCTKIERII